jgi:hypothetical protein
MANSNPLARKLLKGAFIRLDEAGIVPVPKVIVFQYNPETLSRKFKPWEKPADKEGTKPDPSAQSAPYDPEEEMDVVVEFDATDDLEEPLAHPVAMLAGVADRVAALEMLMYPSDEIGLLSSAVASLAGAIGGALGLGGSVTAPIPQRREAPVVLLAWGPGRVVPVKIGSFAVEEQAFNTALYPIRAKVTVGVKVLTDDFFQSRGVGRDLTSAEKLAQSCYRYTLKQKRALSAAQIAHNVESVLSLLPF